MDHPRGVVLFDGVCNFCNASVNFVLPRDQAGYFQFAPIQSSAALRLLKQAGRIDAAAPPFDSMILIEDGRAYEKSDAVLRIARRLGSAWPLIGALLIVPRMLRDPAYSLIARRRYRWFGRREACMIPEPSWQARFLT